VLSPGSNKASLQELLANSFSCAASAMGYLFPLFLNCLLPCEHGYILGLSRLSFGHEPPSTCLED